MTQAYGHASPPQCSAGHSPLRASNSVRRTSTIDVSWSGGREGELKLTGQARDVFTAIENTGPRICANGSMEVLLKPDRTISSIDSFPLIADLHCFIGKRCGGGIRKILASDIPIDKSIPLYLLLDDMPAASLISSWAWSQWSADWVESARAAMPIVVVENASPSDAICGGFAPGSSAFNPNTKRPSGAATVDLRNPSDLAGWHSYSNQRGVGMRRARRIDVQRGSGNIIIDAMFQDSAATPNGTRVVLHEYQISVIADNESQEIISINAEPRVLPFIECSTVVVNLKRLVGSPLFDLRDTVLINLRGADCCTHLNDAFRALEDIPALMQHFDNQ